jgi:Zn-dependent M28 family amino/carboxypeptidase
MATNTLRHIALFIIILALAMACSPKESREKAETKTHTSVNYPDFQADSAFHYVRKQVDFGPRVPNTVASRDCAKWLTETLRRFSPETRVQAFKARAYNGDILNGQNIIASFNLQAKKRILLGAHWDSRPYADLDPDPANHRKPIDGANDGASGVGVLLELARIMRMTEPAVGVDIVLFDAEDYGPPHDNQSSGNEEAWGLGSQYWSKNPHIPNYRAQYGVLLDMVGVPNPSFLMEGFSMYYAPQIVKKVWETAHSLGYGKYFPFEKGGYITDDHYFVNKIANIPMINIIHLEPQPSQNTFFKYWHTQMDNIDNVDPYSLQMVGDVLVRLVYTP